MEPFDLGAATKCLPARERKSEANSVFWQCWWEVCQSSPQHVVFHGKPNCWFCSAPPSVEEFLFVDHHRAASWPDLPILCQHKSGMCCWDVVMWAQLVPRSHGSGAHDRQGAFIWGMCLWCCRIPHAGSQLSSCYVAQGMGSHMISKYRMAKDGWHHFHQFSAQWSTLTVSFGKSLWKMVHFHVLCVELHAWKSMVAFKGMAGGALLKPQRFALEY